MTAPAPGTELGAEQPPPWFERLSTEVAAAQDSPFTRFSPAPGGSPRHSAVLALFGHGPAGDDLLLTQRAATMRSHPGQVAFPGGGIEEQDADAAAAAVREAWEETGVEPAGVDVRAVGPRLYLSVTDFYVTPVLAWWRDRSAVDVVSEQEVSRVVGVPVAQLVDPANRFTVMHPSGFAGPAFVTEGMLIWGFTAGVLNWLLRLAGLEQDWDAGRVLPLPESPVFGQDDVDRMLGRKPGMAE